MTPDPESLASAYLDGELTDDERRIAEADPAAMAEVDELRTLRARLADVEPAGDAAREAAIGAAMAAFHQRHESDRGNVASDRNDDGTVVPLFQRLARPAWLGAAAAAVVLVVAVGVVATRGADDDDSGDLASEAVVLDADDSAEQGAELPAEEPADLPEADADRIAESEMADEVFATESAEDAGELDPSMTEEPASDAVESSDESVDEGETEMAAAEPGDGGADDTAGMIPPLDDPSLHFGDNDGGDNGGVPMQSPLQLRAAAQYLLDERDAGRLGPTPEYRCEFFNVLGAANYADANQGMDVLREVLIDIDETVGVVTAVDRDDCEVVAVITLDGG